MKNIAKTDHEINPILSSRWSPRAFDSSKAINDKDINSLFEAARWAPSAFNAQPWNFVYGKKGDENFDKIYNVMMEGNQVWAKNASLLILVSGNSMHNGKENPTYLYDCGSATAHLSVEASSRGIDVHQMTGFFADKASEVFNLAEDVKPITIIAAGYGTNPDILPEYLAKREVAPRVRKKQEEFVNKF